MDSKNRGGSPSLSQDSDLDVDFAQPMMSLQPAVRVGDIERNDLPMKDAQEPKQLHGSKCFEPMSQYDSGLSSMASTSITEAETVDSITKADVETSVSKLTLTIGKCSLGDEGIGSITESFNDNFKSDSFVKENQASIQVGLNEDSEKFARETAQKLGRGQDGKDDGYHSFRNLSSGNQPSDNINEVEIDFEDILSETDDDGDTLIHTAIVNRNELLVNGMLNLLLTNSRCLNIMNKLFQTVLHLAVLTEQRKIVQKLVHKGCDLFVRDQQGNTALHIACRKGSEKLVKDMVGSLVDNPTKRKELFSIRNCEGLTCLHLAAQGKHYEIMGYLFARGADVNVGDAKSGRTVLHNAVERKDVETVVVLLTHPSIDVDCETYKGETPLLLAYWRNYQDIVKRLKANGAYFSYDLVENDDEGDDY